MKTEADGPLAFLTLRRGSRQSALKMLFLTAIESLNAGRELLKFFGELP
jgi:hypothetical protein